MPDSLQNLTIERDKEIAKMLKEYKKEAPTHIVLEGFMRARPDMRPIITDFTRYFGDDKTFDTIIRMLGGTLEGEVLALPHSLKKELPPESPLTTSEGKNLQQAAKEQKHERATGNQPGIWDDIKLGLFGRQNQKKCKNNLPKRSKPTNLMSRKQFRRETNFRNGEKN